MLGQKNLPPLPADFGESVVDPNIPPPSTGKTESKAKDMASQLPVVPKELSIRVARIRPLFEMPKWKRQGDLVQKTRQRTAVSFEPPAVPVRSLPVPLK